MSIPREMELALTLIHELIRELDKRAVAHYERYHPKYSHIAECLICRETGEEYEHTHKVDCILPRAAAFTLSTPKQTAHGNLVETSAAHSKANSARRMPAQSRTPRPPCGAAGRGGHRGEDTK